MPEDNELIDWNALDEARDAMGADFARLIGYFREDGAKAVSAVEDALRHDDGAAMVIPADILLTGALQFGATKLADMAEIIESAALTALNHHDAPDNILSEVAGLRKLFEDSLTAIDAAASPLVQREKRSAA